jgi:uncharacterized protein (DUF362 family)
VDAVLRLALSRDHSPRSLERIVRDVERFGRGALVPGTGTLLERRLVPQTVARADRFINVAAMKTHGITGVSIGLKNYVGIRPAREDLGIGKGETQSGSSGRW